jgi:hypothetical protein
MQAHRMAQDDRHPPYIIGPTLSSIRRVGEWHSEIEAAVPAHSGGAGAWRAETEGPAKHVHVTEGPRRVSQCPVGAPPPSLTLLRIIASGTAAPETRQRDQNTSM